MCNFLALVPESDFFALVRVNQRFLDYSGKKIVNIRESEEQEKEVSSKIYKKTSPIFFFHFFEREVSNSALHRSGQW